MSEFYVGQKVVCVDDVADGRYYKHPILIHSLDGLRRGHIYTVSELAVEFSGENIVLKEINRERFGPNDYRGFCPERFRPLVTQSKGMEILLALVADPSRPIKADPREPSLTPNEIASTPGAIL